MNLGDVDPFLGDTVRGPDQTTGRVVGVSSIPNGQDYTNYVLVERPDGTSVEWREIDVLVVDLNTEVPIDRRVGRRPS